MKTVACYRLHYGKEWLYYSMRSIINYVDETHIFYSPIPSFGYKSDLKNPDSKKELYNIAVSHMIHGSYKIVWHDCEKGFRTEGQHSDYAMNHMVKIGAERVLWMDADELYDPQHLERLLKFTANSSYQYYAIKYTHFWRSLKWACTDEAQPVRIIMPGRVGGNTYYSGDELPGRMLHMGYAQTSELIRYKTTVSGHKPEWRANWFEEKFLGWKPGDKDVHPTNKDFWTPEHYVDNGALELVAGDHPYYPLDIIQ